MTTHQVIWIADLSSSQHELNSINANILKDIIPVFKVAANRFIEELDNRIESTIQEHYTTIHPAVKWRFIEAAENYQQQLADKVEKPKLKQIVFNDVYPLFGQSDIKGSSIARNHLVKRFNPFFGAAF